MSLRCNVFSGGKDMPFFGAFKSSLALLQIPENIIPSSLRGSVAADPSTIYPSDADLINRAALRTLRVLQRPKTEEEITAFLTLQENSLTAAVYTIYEGDSDFHKEQLRTISALVMQGQDPEDCFTEHAKRHLDLAYRRREQDPAYQNPDWIVDMLKNKYRKYLNHKLIVDAYNGDEVQIAKGISKGANVNFHHPDYTNSLTTAVSKVYDGDYNRRVRVIIALIWHGGDPEDVFVPHARQYLVSSYARRYLVSRYQNTGASFCKTPSQIIEMVRFEHQQYLKYLDETSYLPNVMEEGND